MTKILLITTNFEENTAPFYSDREKVQEHVDASSYPLGITYLHSYMESCGHEVRTLFLNSYSWEVCFEEVARELREFGPGIVGFQILTQNRVSTYRLMEYIHEHYPEIHIVGGGVHASIMYEQLVKKYPYLTVVIGEGELTFGELAETLEEGGVLEKVEGIAFNRGGHVVKTKMRPLIQDLDILPFPKHEIYFARDRTHANILTSRGCPCRCSFCALDSISLAKNRTRSVKNVMEEIEELVRKFPKLKMVWIQDDTFFLNNERVIEFCDEVIRRKIKVEFVCSGRISPFTEKMAKKLEEANFTKLMFGLESGVDDILIKAHKGITQKIVLQTFGILSKTRIPDVSAFLIVGLPGETEETILETADFVRRLQRMKYVLYGDISVLMVYPGTEICKLAKENGQISDDIWLTDATTPFYEVEHSTEELMRYKKLLLDRIAIDRIFTWDALKAQWTMLPYAAAYASRILWRRRRAVVSKVASVVAKKARMPH